MQRITESCWSTSTKKRHKSLGEKGWYMYIAKHLRKISTFPLNFKYYKRILKASTLYKDSAKYKNSIIGLLLQALSWGKDKVAMSGSGPGYMQTIIITPYVHNMIYHVPVVWGSLVDKVFLSIYMSKCMEHGKLNHLLFHDIRYKWIHISQSLGSQNSDYSNRNFLPQYKYPFGEFASFHLFWGVETKNDDLCRHFHRKSNRWDAVTNLLLAEKRQK